MRISILSNVNMDMLFSLLKKEHEIWQPNGYGGWISYALRPDPDLQAFQPECLLVLLEGNELLRRCRTAKERQEEADQAALCVGKLAEQYPSSRLLVSTIDLRPDVIREKDAADESILGRMSFVADTKVSQSASFRTSEPDCGIRKKTVLFGSLLVYGIDPL